MTDTPLTTAQREAIRRSARRRAEQMGYADPDRYPSQAPTDAEVLGDALTRRPSVLRAMLITGRLPQAKVAAARRFLADTARQNPDDTPEDAA